MAFVLQDVINEIEETRSLEPLKKLNKAYRPNAHLLYFVMHYNGSII